MCLRVASGPRVKLATCKSAFNQPPPTPPPPPTPKVYSTDRSKAVVSVLVLLFVALWFILRGEFVFCLTLCHFVLEFFSPFSIGITSLGEERANLSAFLTFVLRFVIVTLPGLFSYHFSDCGTSWTFPLPFLLALLLPNKTNVTK